MIETLLIILLIVVVIAILSSLLPISGDARNVMWLLVATVLLLWLVGALR